MADNFILEIGDFYIRALEGELINNQIKIDFLGSLEKENDFFKIETPQSINLFAKEIKNLITALNIKKKTVNLIIPDTYTYSQILTMPYLKEKELLSAIRFQADQFIPLPIDKTTIDLDILYEDKKNNQLLLLIVAAPNSLVDRCVSLVEQADLIPQNIENQTSSLLRLVNLLNRNVSEKKSSVLINFDFFSTTFYFYDANLNLFSSIFNFKTGLEIFLKEIEINMVLDRVKAIEILKKTDFSNPQSAEIFKIIEPAFNEFINNLNLYIASIKEKNPNLTIQQIYTFNLNSLFFNFEKIIEKKVNIPTMVLDPTLLIYKNNFFNTINQQKSTYLSVLGGLIE